MTDEVDEVLEISVDELGAQAITDLVAYLKAIQTNAINVFDWMNDLTLDDVDLLEDASGMEINELLYGKGSLLSRTIAFYERKKVDPSFTWADAGKVKMNEARKHVEGEPVPLDESE